MPKTHDPEIARRLQDRTAIDAALRRGVRDALARHRQAGVPAVVWENGQTMMIPPDATCADATNTPVKEGDDVSIVAAIAGG